MSDKTRPSESTNTTDRKRRNTKILFNFFTVIIVLTLFPWFYFAELVTRIIFGEYGYVALIIYIFIEILYPVVAVAFIIKAQRLYDESRYAEARAVIVGGVPLLMFLLLFTAGISVYLLFMYAP